MTNINKTFGTRAENFLIKELDKLDVTAEIKNIYYDVLTCEGHKIEVKSCTLTKRNGHNERTIGRFKLSESFNKIKQDENKVWICFIVRHKDNQFILGFLESHKVNAMTSVSIHSVVEYGCLTVGDFLEQTAYD